MTRSRSTGALIWSRVALGIAVGAMAGPAAAGPIGSPAEKPGGGGPAKKASAEAAVKVPAATPFFEVPATIKKKEFRGRLPVYYGKVVDEKQRQKIYAVQREYFARIEFLKGQLAAMIAERDGKVAAVLTPVQLKRVEQLKAEAKAKRARGKGAK